MNREQRRQEFIDAYVDRAAAGEEPEYTAATREFKVVVKHTPVYRLARTEGGDTDLKKLPLFRDCKA
jgi:hypothetical protein